MKVQMLLMISKEFDVLEDELDLSKCFASNRNSSSGSESCSWSGMAVTPGVRESGPDDELSASASASWDADGMNSRSGDGSADAVVNWEEACDTRLEITAADADIIEEEDDKPEVTNVAAAAAIDLVSIPSVKSVLKVGLALRGFGGLSGICTGCGALESSASMVLLGDDFGRSVCRVDWLLSFPFEAFVLVVDFVGTSGIKSEINIKNR